MARFLVSTLGVGGAALLLIGCGGGVPLLHPAHALSVGSTSNSVGFSGVFTAGGFREAVEKASVSSTSQSQGTAEHQMAVAAAAPGVAPVIGMRLGITGDNEIGFTYTGNAIRLDGRHAFEFGPWALSLGAGLAGGWAAKGNDPSDPNAPSARANAAGFDVPVLFGWRSDAGVVSLWCGARGGYEKINPGTLQHWRAGGLVGLMMGFRHVHVALELETSYHGVRGTFNGVPMDLQGLTLTPAGGLLFTF